MHWRIYPIIYALPLLLFLPGQQRDRADSEPTAAGGVAAQRRKPAKPLLRPVLTFISWCAPGACEHGACTVVPHATRQDDSVERHVNKPISAAHRERVVFGLAAGATFLALGLGCYALYGQKFLDEAFL